MRYGATSESKGVAAFDEFLHTHNHHRGRTVLRGHSLGDRVPNLAGQYIQLGRPIVDARSGLVGGEPTASRDRIKSVSR